MKKYLSLNFLSLLGYLCFFITLFFFIVAIPITYNLDLKEHDGGFGFFTVSSLFLVKFYILHLVLLISALFLAIVEFLFKKRSKIIKRPNVLEKIHPFVFWLGIAFALTPFYLLALIYGLAKVISIFQSHSF